MGAAASTDGPPVVPPSPEPSPLPSLRAASTRRATGRSNNAGPTDDQGEQEDEGGESPGFFESNENFDVETFLENEGYGKDQMSTQSTRRGKAEYPWERGSPSPDNGNRDVKRRSSYERLKLHVAATKRKNDSSATESVVSAKEVRSLELAANVRVAIDLVSSHAPDSLSNTRAALRQRAAREERIALKKKAAAAGSTAAAAEPAPAPAPAPKRAKPKLVNDRAMVRHPSTTNNDSSQQFSLSKTGTSKMTTTMPTLKRTQQPPVSSHRPRVIQHGVYDKSPILVDDTKAASRSGADELDTSGATSDPSLARELSELCMDAEDEEEYMYARDDEAALDDYYAEELVERRNRGTDGGDPLGDEEWQEPPKPIVRKTSPRTAAAALAGARGSPPPFHSNPHRAAPPGRGGRASPDRFGGSPTPGAGAATISPVRRAPDGSSKAAEGKGAVKRRHIGFLSCYCCGREYTAASLPRHLTQCPAERISELKILPPELNPGVPPPLALAVPTETSTAAEVEAYNSAAHATFTAHTPTCPNCGRHFEPDSLLVHVKGCKAVGTKAKAPGGRR